MLHPPASSSPRPPTPADHAPATIPVSYTPPSPPFLSLPTSPTIIATEETVVKTPQVTKTWAVLGANEPFLFIISPPFVVAVPPMFHFPARLLTPKGR